MNSAPFSDFVVGREDFGGLQINRTAQGGFYYFSRQHEPGYVKHFVLAEKPRVIYVCQVTLIEKNQRFSPRLTFAVRNRKPKLQGVPTAPSSPGIAKAMVSLQDCHENFWQLISYLQSLREIDIPEGSFSLVSREDGEIVEALRKRKKSSLVSIIKQLSSTQGLSLSHDDVNHLLRRRERLQSFGDALASAKSEPWWQEFFERNKWIFGYGLDYQILRQDQTQPNYGGTAVSGSGGQRGDYLASTAGEISFTVLVEIKTPETPLLQGNKEIRSGAWSLSKNLADALSQIQANVHAWEIRGSELPANRDRLEKEGIYTVHPKGIVVIGSLGQLASERSKRETFQRFRRAIHGIEIMTFDELYSRARFIVDNKT